MYLLFICIQIFSEEQIIFPIKIPAALPKWAVHSWAAMEERGQLFWPHVTQHGCSAEHAWPGRPSREPHPAGLCAPGARERLSLSRGVACRPTIPGRTCKSASRYLQPGGALSEAGMKLSFGSLERGTPGARGFHTGDLWTSQRPRGVVVFPGPGGLRGLGARSAAREQV